MLRHQVEVSSTNQQLASRGRDLDWMVLSFWDFFPSHYFWDLLKTVDPCQISLTEISVRDTWTPSGCSAIPVTPGIRERRRLMILVTPEISWRRCASVVSYYLCVIVLRECVWVVYWAWLQMKWFVPSAIYLSYLQIS
jgi:hypothetical protein